MAEDDLAGTVTWGELLDEARARFERVGSASAAVDARRIVEAASGFDGPRFVLARTERVDGRAERLRAGLQLQEAAALADAAVVLLQRGQHGGEPGDEAGQPVGRVLLELAQVEPDFEHRAVGPDVGAAQMGHLQYCYLFLVRHGCF